jgi:hypothetical protein
MYKRGNLNQFLSISIALQFFNTTKYAKDEMSRHGKQANLNFWRPKHARLIFVGNLLRLLRFTERCNMQDNRTSNRLAETQIRFALLHRR